MERTRLRSSHAVALAISQLILAVGCESASSTTAETVSYEPGGVQISIPSPWKSKRQDDKQILNSPDGVVTMIFFAPPERGLEAGMAEVKKTVRNLKNTGVDQTSKPIADKMRVQNYYGEGEVSGARVKWILTLVDKDTFEEPRLAVLTFGNRDTFDRNAAKVVQIVTGIKRIR